MGTEEAIIPRRYLKLRDLATYLGTSIYAARKFAVSIGAERRVGKLLIYDMNIINKALDAQGGRNEQDTNRAD